MDPVIPDHRVNGGMQFDAGHFRAAERLVEVNVVDVVSFAESGWASSATSAIGTRFCILISFSCIGTDSCTMTDVPRKSSILPE